MTEPRLNEQPQLPPDNNLVWAILATLLCCWPLGIPAIINAARVDRLWMGGNHTEAIQAANDAKKWAIISVCGGVVFWFIYGIIILVASLATY